MVATLLPPVDVDVDYAARSTPPGPIGPVTTGAHRDDQVKNLQQWASIPARRMTVAVRRCRIRAMASNRSSRPRVLLVDDDPRLIHIVSLYLQVQQLEVITADCGETALAHLERGLPDLVISDIMMPGIDGIELCRRIRAMEGAADLPVIMFTALSSDADRELALAAGADRVIAKPFNLTGLGGAVQAMLPHHLAASA